MKQAAIARLKISSEAFGSMEHIPIAYTCEGDNYNPPLLIERLPEGTKSMVIIVDDPDAPRGTFNHWVVWNIPPTTKIEMDSIPSGVVGKNDYGRSNYAGPCPPSGTHRYFFIIFALDSALNLSPDSKSKIVYTEMEGKILGYGELIGLYSKK